MKIYLGIDPGKAGAVCWLENGKFSITDAEDVSLSAMADLLRNKEAFVLIEQAQAMPKQGVVSMFNYGKGQGKYLGTFESNRIPYQEIHPMKWKKEFCLVHKPKEMSIQRAIQLFPEMADYLTRKKDHGRAEALLMAEYARRHNM